MILQNEDREWISRGIWNRIYHQYPSLLAENKENSVENGVSPSAGIAPPINSLNNKELFLPKEFTFIN